MIILLQMAALEIQGNGEGTTCAQPDAIKSTLESLENDQQRVCYRADVYVWESTLDVFNNMYLKDCMILWLNIFYDYLNKL